MFSGEPVTTLGNTLRSLAYAKLYAGDQPYYALASGDDICIFCDDPKLVKQNVRKLTSKDPLVDSPLG